MNPLFFFLSRPFERPQARPLIATQRIGIRERCADGPVFVERERLRDCVGQSSRLAAWLRFPLRATAADILDRRVRMPGNRPDDRANILAGAGRSARVSLRLDASVKPRLKAGGQSSSAASIALSNV